MLSSKIHSLAQANQMQEAGLAVGICVEPIGPEHTHDEIAEMILFTPCAKACDGYFGFVHA